MSVELIRGLYDYHRWANRQLFDVAAGLGKVDRPWKMHGVMPL